ncbi:RrF2 family transcriptional regulator [Gillisia hiemivivida]|uniref:Rrf2 family transcriptional regulator n=1 Tax=Gillisia hiemivivida TaxID=291190 RepID=A0A5C6ZZD6_9FLAO|nr:Rrf2 family transcriptional regulator [Gillisia hiemivivida]TXD94763.1 Rrf2 family transcriptional regulator [Gillisia hiemivivida]
MFSKACEYGIKASTYIALQSLQNRRVSLKEIAEEINSPVAFTAKILHQLAKSDVLKSNKGPSGGFEIPKVKIDTLMLSEIVFAIDGNSVYEGCALGFNECNSKIPCPLHDKFVDIRDELKNMLTKTSLYELATGLEVGLTFLKR